jgi:cobalt-zinc-cadmium efflux system outer membrane protein
MLLFLALAEGQAALAQSTSNRDIQNGTQVRYREAVLPLSQNGSSENLARFSESRQALSVRPAGLASKMTELLPEGQTPPPIPLAGEGISPAEITPLPLQTALEWTLSSNPDLIAIRQNLRVSRDALAVACQFPTSLNPTVSMDVRPWVFDRPTGQGIEQLATVVNLNWQQPIEFGHRTEFRAAIAHASYSQTRWNILQAELLAMVQTYRFHQSAVYRLRKFRIASQLAEFNERLLQALKRQMQANQISAADVVLAEVENQSTRQRVETARQEYIVALTELCQQIGAPQFARAVEVVGELQPPGFPDSLDESALVQSALVGRPEILAAQAQVSGSHAAVGLARADRIPIPTIGPVYEKDENNVSFYGLGFSSPIPVLNSGARLLHQRESEHLRDKVSLEQTRQKVVTQVKTAFVRCNEARRLRDQTGSISAPLQEQATRMERLYDAGQADLVKLFQVRQRLIEAENTLLDANWQVVQAYCDLLLAIGGTPLVAAIPEPISTPADK